MLKNSVRLFALLIAICSLASCNQSPINEKGKEEIVAEVYHGIVDPDPEKRVLYMDSENVAHLQYQIENVGNKAEYGLFALTNGIVQPLLINGTEMSMYKMTLDAQETVNIDVEFSPIFFYENQDNFLSFHLMLDPDMNFPDEYAWYTQRVSQTLGWRIESGGVQFQSPNEKTVISNSHLIYSADKNFQSPNIFDSRLSYMSSGFKNNPNGMHELCIRFSSEVNGFYRLFLCYDNTPLAVFDGKEYLDVETHQGIEYLSQITIDSNLISTLDKSFYIIATVVPDDLDSYESFKSNSVTIP